MAGAMSSSRAWFCSISMVTLIIPFSLSFFGCAFVFFRSVVYYIAERNQRTKKNELHIYGFVVCVCTCSVPEPTAFERAALRDAERFLRL